jgi:hypothetical protein
MVAPQGRRRTLRLGGLIALATAILLAGQPAGGGGGWG